MSSAGASSSNNKQNVRKAPRNQSGIWEHCEKILHSETKKLKQIKCNYCQKVYEWGSFTTFKSHLSKTHDIIVVITDNQDEGTSSNENNESETNNINSSASNQSDSILNSYNSNTSSKSTFSRNKIAVMSRTLPLFIITACLPFRIVENVYFIKFVHLLCPSYVVPDRRTLALTTLDETYELIVNQIKNKLKSATSICATTDLWTSTQKLPYIGVTIHFFDDNFKFHNYTICM